MEGLGKKLQEARLARNLTLDEAARITKIRPVRLQEIENEDFSEFSSLAYAKGFLLIYGKFLDVDVSHYLDAFETSESVTVDGYSYLQAHPTPKPSRPAGARKHSSSGDGRGSFLPFLIGVIVLLVGFVGMRLILEVQRLKPGLRPVAGTSPTATATSEKIIAPQALLAEQPTSPTPVTAITQPTIAARSPIPQPSVFEPEVRRAEPVHPDDLPKTKPSAPPTVRKQFRTPGSNLDPGLSPIPRPIPR